MAARRETLQYMSGSRDNNVLKAWYQYLGGSLGAVSCRGCGNFLRGLADLFVEGGRQHIPP
jgi:hypothetical protein